MRRQLILNADIVLSLELPDALNLNVEVAPAAFDVQLILTLAAGDTINPDRDITALTLADPVKDFPLAMTVVPSQSLQLI